MYIYIYIYMFFYSRATTTEEVRDHRGWRGGEGPQRSVRRRRRGRRERAGGGGGGGGEERDEESRRRGGGGEEQERRGVLSLLTIFADFNRPTAQKGKSCTNPHEFQSLTDFGIKSQHHVSLVLNFSHMFFCVFFGIWSFSAFEIQSLAVFAKHLDETCSQKMYGKKGQGPSLLLLLSSPTLLLLSSSGSWTSSWQQPSFSLARAPLLIDLSIFLAQFLKIDFRESIFHLRLIWWFGYDFLNFLLWMKKKIENHNIYW